MQMRIALLFACITACGSLAACVAPAAGNTCSKDDECPDGQQCLTEFKGGYCGHKPCAANADCPDKSICVTLDAVNYCFLKCTDKPDCNQNRTVDNEANCSSTVKPVDGSEQKVCVPPSGI